MSGDERKHRTSNIEHSTFNVSTFKLSLAVSERTAPPWLTADERGWTQMSGRGSNGVLESWSGRAMRPTIRAMLSAPTSFGSAGASPYRSRTRARTIAGGRAARAPRCNTGGHRPPLQRIGAAAGGPFRERQAASERTAPPAEDESEDVFKSRELKAESENGDHE